MVLTPLTPRSAIIKAMALPIPLDPPVTIAIFPAKDRVSMAADLFDRVVNFLFVCGLVVACRREGQPHDICIHWS